MSTTDDRNHGVPNIPTGMINHGVVGFYVLKLIVCKQKTYSIFNKVIIVVYSVKIVIE